LQKFQDTAFQRSQIFKWQNQLETALLQHRQLHRIFVPILCTAIYLLYYACPSIPLCVSLDCSVDGVSPPPGAIRNRRSIL